MKKLLLIVSLFMLMHQVSAQNYKFQALFIFNIAQRIEWPSVTEDFIIGVMGSKEIQNELQAISNKRQLFGHPINVKQLTGSTQDIQDCHLIYVGRGSSSKLSELISAINSEPILLVGCKQGAKGLHINFIDKPGKIEFEIYPSIIQSHQLYVSKSLLELGIVKN